MLTIIALLAGMQPAGTPIQASELDVKDEITVIGKKLQAWRGSMRTRDGVARCVTKTSTGDRDIDQIGCTAMVTCFSKFESEFKSALLTGSDQATRSRQNAEINERLAACVEERHDMLVEDLADQRAAKRL